MKDNLIARTILKQLGGYDWLHLMIEANSFAFGPNALSFNFKGSHYHAVRIDLTPKDLYNVIFFHRSGTKIEKESFEDIYVDDLAQLFENVTKLRITED